MTLPKRKAAGPSPHQAYFDSAEAAGYLGVSDRFFWDHLRSLLPVHDFRAPGSDRPMPKYARTDLDAWALSRRKVSA